MMLEWIVTSSVLIALLTAVRYALRGKIGLRLQYALWALALVRLLVPVSLGHSAFSVMNVIPEKTPEAALSVTVPEGAYTAPADKTPLPVPAVPEGEAEPPFYLGVTETAPPVAVDRGAIAGTVWIFGAAAVGLWFLLANLRFAIRLRKSRRPLDTEAGRLPVYVSDAIDTPCLFGLFRPAVYLTEAAAADETVLRHALEHELTHFRHGDHIWGALRGVCLALHWYNPLVWLAAVLSRRDSELACDEGAIRRLGEHERAAYGRTLIGLTCEKRTALLVAATTMTGSGLRERIRLIAKRPRTAAVTLVIVLLAAAIAAGCTLTGAKEKTAEDGPEAASSADAAVRERNETEPSPERLPAPEIVFELDENVPQAAADYALDYTAARLRELDAPVTEARITGLKQMNTGTAGLYDAIDMYLLEYRFLTADGETVTERSDEGQPYLLLYHSDAGLTELWERVCDTTTAAIERDYGTPEMLEIYGNPYTAAAVQLFAQHEARLKAGLRLAEAPADAVCVELSPTEGGRAYVPLPDRDAATAVYEKAVAAADPSKRWRDGDEDSGLAVVYNDVWWCVTRAGALVGDGRVEPEAARELVDYAFIAAWGAGLRETVRPEAIGPLTGAVLEWYGTAAVTDPAALSRIEALLSSAENLIGGAGCPFTAYLTLTTKDGRTLRIALATDSCGVYMSEGAYYRYASGNEELFSFFAPQAIHEAISDPDALALLLPYLNWSYYDAAYGADGVFALIDALRAYAMPVETTTDSDRLARMMTVMYATVGLDGYHADAYASFLRELYDYDGKTFAWCCLGNIGGKHAESVVGLLAYATDRSAAETRRTLEALIP